eukprot:TRINITY_DN37807_c0_g1_i1.p1 TRINITY_DN37807_c0_g1~~TRINITY_DN37807_c0_g1_i1.p1  ORF type:complete len:232 (-),score=50.65 TRINITY_DN37807_c0_g1_i1:57-752(-)
MAAAAVAGAGDDDMGLPLPAMAIEEESLFDAGADTLDAKLLLLGLDNAGKTTLLQMLKNDRLIAQVPTLHPQTEEFIIDKVRYQAFDLAGHETCRRLWKDYYRMAKAILFLVDAADRSRFPEAAEEISHLMKDPILQATPIAVMGQKIDLKDAASEAEFKSAMGVTDTNGRPVEVFMCSVLERRGYGDALRWIQRTLVERLVHVPFAIASGGTGTSATVANTDFGEEDDFV